MSTKHIIFKEKKFWLIFGISIMLLCFLILISSFVGAVDISFWEIIKSFWKGSSESNNFILWNLRFPRIIISIIAGSTIALSGVFVQASLKNPLASPSILGVSTGAAFGGVLVILLLPSFPFFIYLGAVLGGFFAFFVVLLFSYKKGFSSLHMVLIGVGVNAFFAALISLLFVFNIDRLGGVLNFINGHIDGNWNDANKLIIGGVPIIFASFFFSKICDTLLLDDKTLSSLGINASNLRLKAIILSVVLLSISIYVCGIIGFVGLIIPHIVKMTIGSNHLKVIPLSIIWGSILVLGTDLVGTIIFRPYEIPIGILISFLGTPFFIYVLNKEAR